MSAREQRPDPRLALSTRSFAFAPPNFTLKAWQPSHLLRRQRVVGVKAVAMP